MATADQLRLWNVTRAGIRKSDVELEPIRQAVMTTLMRRQWTLAELAGHCGFGRNGGGGRPDPWKLKRALGMTPQTRNKTHLRYETALRIIDGLGADPVDVGL